MLQCVAVRCSVLQFVAMHFSVLQRVAVCQFEATHCNTLKFAVEVAPLCNIPVVVCCSVLQCVAARCSVLQRVAVRCNALQCAAVRFSVLQFVNLKTHTATRCNLLPRSLPF